jgi:phage-related minor tail protein
MAGNIKGITIEFRGETSALDQAIKKVNSEIKSTDSELKKVNNALKFNPGSVELWRQKQDLLKQKISETKEKLDILKDTQKKVDSGEIEMTAEEYRNLQREIIESESKLKTFNAQLRQVGNANLTALSQQLKTIGDKMTSIGKSMTQKVTAPIVAGYTVAAKYASDYEENLNKIDVAFGSNSQAVKDWANTARTEFGLSKVQATEAAAAFGALGKGIGLSEKDAANMSTTLAGLSADLGSYFNTGVDESAKALEGIFTGESEALKKFGVVMTDTNLEKFAADQGLVWKKMDQGEKTMLRYQYVLAKTKDAQGDYSRTSDGTANSIKTFQASIQDLATAIGTNLLPIITPIIQKITEWVNKFNELPAPVQKVITVIGLIVAVLGPVLVIIGTLISAIGSIISVISTVGPIIAGVAGPIGIAVAAIAGLIAFGVFLYKNWDTIKAKAIAVWNAIKAFFVNTLNSIKNTFTNIWNGIKTTIMNVWNSMKTFITNGVNGWKIILSNAWNSIKNTASSVWNGIKSAITNPIQTALNVVKGIVNKLKNLFPLKVGKIFSNLKIPHIKVNGGKAPFGIGGKGSAPHISVDWYAQGGIFTRPTLLGANGGRLAGVGEAGAEAVLPIERLREMVDFGNAQGNAIIAQQTQILIAIYEELQKEKNFKVDGVWAGRYVNSLVR